MAKPACPRCGLFYRPRRNGAGLEEGKPYRHGDQPVRHTEADGTEWTSYKLWAADLWECRGCGSQVLISNPQHYAEHYQPSYSETRERSGGDLVPFIHDC